MQSLPAAIEDIKVDPQQLAKFERKVSDFKRLLEQANSQKTQLRQEITQLEQEILARRDKLADEQLEVKKE